MRKIIDGKLYDTETAKVVGDYQYSNYTDFNYFYECLYKKRTGEYFLYYEGGPASKYSKYVGSGTTSGSSGIEPLDYFEAQKFVEKRLSVSVYDSEFGLPDETGSKEIFSIVLSAESAFLLRKMSGMLNKTLSFTVDKIIFDYYQNEYGE